MARKRTSVAFIAGKQSRDLSDGRHCAVDAHGDIDLYSEFGWQNVKIVVEKNLKQIQGVNLNCLLRALFILYGYENISDLTLPGGFYCWEVLLESFFVSITHLCSVEDIIRRIHHLIDLYLNGDGTDGSADGENYAIGNVLYGAFSFMMFWIQAFHAYMADIHLTKLKSGIIGLGQKLNAPTEDDITRRNRYSYNYTEVLEKLRGRYAELRNAAHHVTQCRLLNTIGLTRQLTSLQEARYGGGRTGAKDYRTMTFVHQSYMQPNVRTSTAAWTGFEAQRKKEELKKTLAAAPQVKLEIFGGEALLDASDDEDDVAPATATGKRGKGAFFGSEEDEQGPPSPPPPVVRVEPTFSLLQEPYALSLDLFSVDPQELARQWTLADHALFCNIALHSLLPPAGTNTSISSLSRSQQAKLGILGTGVFGGCRAFIDRFNALSAWVTSSILQQAEVGARAERVAFFIRVGAHLAELANFNGLMAVVTALQQGCVARLRWTFEQVPKAERAKLGQLQRVMEGSKNYQRYRVEVAKLAPQFYLSTVGRGGAGSAGRGSGAGLEDFGDVDWKREVVRRYKADLSVLRSPNPNPNPNRLGSGEQGHGDEGEGYSAPRLMRTASVNGMMLAKAHSLDHTEQPWNTNFQAMVPHMGAHLAELTSITEGNGDYLVDRPYLFNTHKLALLAGTLSVLHKMQQLRYNLTPVRAIIAALNFTAKRHVKLTPAGASEQAKQLFALSHAVEPAGMAPPSGAELSDRASSVGGSAAGGRGSVAGAGARAGPGAGAGRGAKTRSGSQAYLRITGKIAEEGEGEEGDSEEEGSGESEQEDEYEGEASKPRRRKLLSRPFKLLRTFTSAFLSSPGHGSNK